MGNLIIKTKEEGSVTSIVRSFSFPSGWAEIPLKKRFLAASLLLLHPKPQGYISFLMKIVGVPRKVLTTIPSDILQELFEQIRTSFSKEYTTPIIESFEYKGIIYRMPSPDFMKETAFEFALADEYFGNLKENELEASLLSVLAQPVKNGERKVPKLRSEVEANSKALEGVHPLYMLLAVYYFIDIKKLINNTYGKYLFSQDEVSQPDPFSWWGVFFRLAETGAFGKVDDVPQYSFHTICQYLTKIKMDEETAQSKMNKNIRNDI